MAKIAILCNRNRPTSIRNGVDLEVLFMVSSNSFLASAGSNLYPTSSWGDRDINSNG